jgi:hypothetical protein
VWSARAEGKVSIPVMFNYATYPDGSAVYDILGFGKPPEEVPFAATPGVFTFGWGPVLHQLADGLGVRIDDIKETVERSTLTGYVEGSHTFRSNRVISATAEPPAKASTVSRSRAHRRCGASSRWPTTMITIWAPGWPERLGWSARFLLSAPRSPVSCRRWTCR